MDRIDLTPHPYAYPSEPHLRRHGPAGYTDYKSYRPWLEDEFSFRCVYCLSRMVWAPTQTWVVDHLVSRRERPDLLCDYDNLVLACAFCNGQKGSKAVPDPCRVAYARLLTVECDGTVTAHGADGVQLLKRLRLNHPHLTAERAKTIRILTVLAQHDPAEFERLMGFPDRLPDLRRKRGKNLRPAGLEQSYHAQRLRGELPKTY